MPGKLKWSVIGTITVIAVLGLAIALENLPVRTGCGYYGICGVDAIAD